MNKRRSLSPSPVRGTFEATRVILFWRFCVLPSRAIAPALSLRHREHANKVQADTVSQTLLPINDNNVLNTPQIAEPIWI